MIPVVASTTIRVKVASGAKASAVVIFATIDHGERCCCLLTTGA